MTSTAMGTLKVSKWTQTTDDGDENPEQQIKEIAKQQQTVERELLASERSLVKLNQMIDALKSDLQIKVAFSEKRRIEKEALLQVIEPGAATKATASASALTTMMSTSQDENERPNVVESTQDKIRQVIQKERQIQQDLQACVDKLTGLKEALEDEIENTVREKTDELNGITGLVQFITEAA